MGLSLIGILSLAGCAAGLLSAAVLLRIPHGHRVANRVLAALMVILALILLQRFLSVEGLVYAYPHLQAVAGPLNFLLGPLFYLYLRLMSQRDFILSRQQLKHGWPALLSVLGYLPVYLSSAQQKREFINHYMSAGSSSSWASIADQWYVIGTINLLQSLAFSFLLGVYALASIRQLIRHRRSLADNFSETERLTLSWLQGLAWLAMVTTVASVVAIVLAPWGSSLISSQLITVTLLVVICFYGGYSGICQPLIYHYAEQVADQQLVPENTARSTTEAVKYQRSGLSGEGQKLLWQQLQSYMQEQQPYLTGGLTISQLAQQLDLSVAYLSQTINGEAGMSYFDFINRARIDEARRLLDEAGSNASVSTLYLAVGFNSKSSFYTQFKKYCGGLTPTQYLLK